VPCSKYVSLHGAMLNAVDIGSFPSQKERAKASEILRDTISKYMLYIMSPQEASMNERV